MIRSFLDAFGRCRDGAVHMIFVIVVPAVLALIAMAVEINSVEVAGRAVQEALDAATLAAARAAVDDNTARQKIAEDFIKQNLSSRYTPYLKKIEINGNADDVLIGRAVIHFPLFMGQMLGRDMMDIHRETQVKASPDAKLELSLVLDTTGSMTGSRMSALRQAGKDLADTVMDGENVRVAVVPFARYVNIGITHRNAAGLDIPKDEPDVEKCEWKDEYEKKNCKKVTRDCDKTTCKKVKDTCYNDGVPYTCWKDDCKVTGTEKCEVEECDQVPTGKKTRNCWTEHGRNWTGCIGSRDYPLNLQDTDPHKEIPGVFASCNNAVLRLTTSIGQVKSIIDSLATTDETYTAAGMIWGWRTISHRVPFPDGINPASDDNVRKAIVMMTDGINTRVKNNHDEYHNDGDTKRSNNYFSEVCENIKDDDITIYTVALEVTDTDTKKILSDCASDAEKFFDAKDTKAFKDAFAVIAKDLKVLHIYR